MARPNNYKSRECAGIANTFDLTMRQAMKLWPSLNRVTSELAERAIISSVKKVRERHEEPILIGRGLQLIDSQDSITLVMRKTPSSVSMVDPTGRTRKVL
jgi:hypothetical protein